MNLPLELDDLLDQVQSRAGLSARAQALEVTRRVLAALDKVLLVDELMSLREVLPPSLHKSLPREARSVTSSIESFFSSVRRRERVRYPQAVEHAEAVCGVLGGALPPDVHARWSRDLPPRVARLFTPAHRPRESAAHPSAP